MLGGGFLSLFQQGLAQIALQMKAPVEFSIFSLWWLPTVCYVSASSISFAFGELIGVVISIENNTCETVEFLKNSSNREDFVN